MIVMLCATTDVAAQTIAEVRNDARLNVGPFYVTPTIQLKELGWDSNVFNEATENRLSDFMMVLSPAAKVWLPVARRALIGGTGGVDALWYAKYKNQRGLNPFGSLNGDLYLGRLTLSGGYDYLRTRQRVNDEVDLRARRIEGTAKVNIEYRVKPKFSLGLAGDRHTTAFDEQAIFQGQSLKRSLDRISGGGSVIARYTLTPLTTVRMTVSRFGDRFQFAPERDSDSWSAMSGVEFKPRAMIQGSAEVGFRWFLPKEGSPLPVYRGLATNARLGYTMLGSTKLVASWSRGLAYSFDTTTPYFIDQRVGLSVQRAFARRFDILGSTERHGYDYRARVGAVPPDLIDALRQKRSDVTWNSAASVGYEVVRGGRLGAGVNYWVRRSSTKTIPDYERLQYTITFSYGLLQ